MTLLGPIFTGDNGLSLYPGSTVSTSTLIGMMGGAKTHAGTRVTEEKSLGMPAVWRAVNLIAGTIASLPLHAYRQDGEIRTKVTDGPAAELLAEPHPDLTPFEFWETVLTHQLLWGNAYLHILCDQAGRVRELWPIPPSDVQVGRVSNLGEKIYLVSHEGLDNGQPTVQYDDTILHLPAFGYDGICGVSPIRVARQGIGLALAAEEYGARLFGSGSLATGVLQTEQRLTQAQADTLADRWKAKRAGLQGAHETIILDKGAEFHTLSIPPEDAQFIESRGFQVEEIARMFGIPPHMLMAMDKATSWGTGIEQQTIAFVVYTLRSWLTRTEQRVSRILSPKPTYARYSLEGLLRGDSAQRAAFYKSMWEIGAYSTNDVLKLEDRPPVDGGDVRHRPMNMGELGVFSEGSGSPAPSAAAVDAARAILNGSTAALPPGHATAEPAPSSTPEEAPHA